MKKVVLFALLLATVAAASAQAAHHEPKWGVPYYCYYDNYYGNATDGGQSKWYNPVYYLGGDLIRCLEDLDTSYGGDTYKCSWAKPETPWPMYKNSTTWEFTFNPYGPQCKRTVVSPDRNHISFQQCTDGHTRYCEAAW